MPRPIEERTEEHTTTTTTTDPIAGTPPVSTTTTMHSSDYRPPRRRWPGLLVAALMAAGITAIAVSSYYDDRSLGEKLDATVANAQQKMQQQAEDLRAGASEAARSGAAVTERAAGALSDAGITAAVKTALAADPRLSALKIDVDTEGGVVSLEGPAPDEDSRQRAEVLAAAPDGVQRVDNRLVVSPPAGTTMN